MNTRLTHILPAIALAAICGCAAKQAPTGDARIFLDSGIDLEVHDVHVDRNGSGTLNLQALFVSRHGSEQLAQYKVEWLDDAGNYSDSILSRWAPLRVTAGAPVRIRATAPNPAISDFRLQIRRNKAKGYE